MEIGVIGNLTRVHRHLTNPYWDFCFYGRFTPYPHLMGALHHLEGAKPRRLTKLMGVVS